MYYKILLCSIKILPLYNRSTTEVQQKYDNYSTTVNKIVMKKLIPLSDFVLEQENELENILTERLPILKTTSALSKIIDYAKFLKQPLTLGMFVPTDEDGNVLKQPIPVSFGKCVNKRKRLYEPIYVNEDIDVFEKAMAHVLFDGFQERFFDQDDIIESVLYFKNCYVGIKYKGGQMQLNDFAKDDMIEDLVEHSLNLTPSALEAIGIKE